MPIRLILVLILFGILSLKQLIAQAQQHLYNIELVSPDPDTVCKIEPEFTYSYIAYHHISERVRGVKGNDGVVYWVTSDKQCVQAYRGNNLLWEVDAVMNSQPDIIGTPEIRALGLAGKAILVVVGKHAFVEIDRKRGSVEDAWQD